MSSWRTALVRLHGRFNSMVVTIHGANYRTVGRGNRSEILRALSPSVREATPDAAILKAQQEADGESSRTLAAC